ncbi:MAG: hypothetical protein AMXMBFR20_09440 [Planctomycetia bacterium]
MWPRSIVAFNLSIDLDYGELGPGYRRRSATAHTPTLAAVTMRPLPIVAGIRENILRGQIWLSEAPL